MHLNSRLLFLKYALPYFKDNMNVLEIGPTGFPSYYCKLVNNPTIKWHTLDIGTDYLYKGENNPLHIVSRSEYNYPVEENKFDIVISGQVMEHVKKIWTWVDELKRITKKGGLIISISPVSWDYHEAPVDCWRIYPEGMKALMQDKGLTVKECKFESLEKEQLSRSIPTTPGTSVMDFEGKFSWKYKFLLGLLHIPVVNKLLKPISVSYDTVCISEKS